MQGQEGKGMRDERWTEDSCKKRGRGVKQTANKGEKEEMWRKQEGEKIQVWKMRRKKKLDLS